MNKNYKLGQLCSIKHGYPFDGKFFSDHGEFIILTPGNFFEEGGFKRIIGKEKYYTSDFPAEYLCKQGDLIVAMTQQAEGLLGSTALVPEDNLYLHNQRVGLIFPNDMLVDKVYLYYLFMTESVRTQIRNSASGTKVKHTSPEKIYDVTVQIPDKSIQKSNAKLLYNIEQKVNNNIRICSELEAMAKTLYDYWFVQFDFPDKNGKPYCTSGGEMVWNDQLKREIPKGWTVSPLLDLCSWNGGSQPPKSQHIYTEKPGYVRFIQNRDYAADNHLTFIPISDNNKLCDKLDIMVDKYGEAGKTRYGIAGAYNVALSRIDVKFPDTQEYIRSFLSSDAIKNYLANSCMASTRASLNEDNLSMLNVVVPTSKILKQYEQFGKLIIYKTLSLKQESEELIKLRDWLLPMLMNGQATVE